MSSSIYVDVWLWYGCVGFMCLIVLFAVDVCLRGSLYGCNGFECFWLIMVWFSLDMSVRFRSLRLIAVCGLICGLANLVVCGGLTLFVNSVD